jgi:hypothetical protein
MVSQFQGSGTVPSADPARRGVSNSESPGSDGVGTLKFRLLAAVRMCQPQTKLGVLVYVAEEVR